MGFFGIFSKNGKNKVVEPKLIRNVNGNLDSFMNKFYNNSLIILINGKRGSGKTALAFYLLELLNKKTRRKCHVLGYEKIRLPWFIKKISDVGQVKNNSILLIDEGSLSYSARQSMKKVNIELSKIMAIARHKNLTLIVITQSAALVDLNIIRLTDTLIFKQPSLLQSEFERKAIKGMYDKVLPYFEKENTKIDKFFIWDDEFQGLLEHPLPYFWSQEISKSLK